MPREGRRTNQRRRDARPDSRGEALHRSLRQYIAGLAIRLLSQFDVDDVETTVRALQAITARAQEEVTVVS